jgi:hypothetical protein
MKFFLFSAAIAAIFYASYLYDVSKFKRELRRRDLHMRRYEQKQRPPLTPPGEGKRALL